MIDNQNRRAKDMSEQRGPNLRGDVKVIFNEKAIKKKNKPIECIYCLSKKNLTDM